MTDDAPITLFLCGDVMTGRGIDQVLPHPCDPTLHEDHVKDARDYVALAERASGPIGAPLPFADVWGDALAVLAAERPHARIANLETAITRSDAYSPGKAVHYRMNPDNAGCLAAAGLDVCVLANNHVLDWGMAGLADTLAALDRLGIRRAGAGASPAEAAAPAVVPLPTGGRILVLAFGSVGAGVPSAWAAAAGRPGVNLLPDRTTDAVRRIAGDVRAARRPGDIVLLSIHWGPNWGHEITAGERQLAHALIDDAGVDVVHGHSSHHARTMEVHRDRLILYGCGDLLTDYEGIRGYESYRADLGLMYFPTLAPDGRLLQLDMVPTRMRRFRITRAEPAEARWLAVVLGREGRRLGTAVELADGARLRLSRDQAAARSDTTS